MSIEARFSSETARQQDVYRVAVEQMSASLSHGKDHIDSVIHYASELSNSVEVDWNVLFPACCLHDLGRLNTYLHQQNSRLESLKKAHPILRQLGYSAHEIGAVLTAIWEHDDFQGNKTTNEAVVLSEADFLSGFGARGIMRIMTWGAESGRTVKQMIERIEKGMPERIKSLQLPQSKQIAWRQWPCVLSFLASFKEDRSVEKQERKGWYVAIEGVSATGKDTQADLLVEHLKERGHEVLRVAEPSVVYKTLSKAWENNFDKPTEQQKALLFAADRSVVAEEINKALAGGKTVVAVRGIMSGLAYQGDNFMQRAWVFQINAPNLPMPDLVVCLDVQGSEEKLSRRVEDRGRERGTYENAEAFGRVGRNFDSVVAMFPQLSVLKLNAMDGIDDIQGRIREEVEKFVDF